MGKSREWNRMTRKPLRPEKRKRFEIVIEKYFNHTEFCLRDNQIPGKQIKETLIDDFLARVKLVLRDPTRFQEIATYLAPHPRKTETEQLVEEYLAKGGIITKVSKGASAADKPKLTLADIGLDFGQVKTEGETDDGVQ